MKVLVTGATGFLGQWLTRRLVEEGHQVRILKRPKTDLDTLNGLPIDVAPGDVTDADSVRAACIDIHRVYHLAAIVAYTKRERASMEAVNAPRYRSVSGQGRSTSAQSQFGCCRGRE